MLHTDKKTTAQIVAEQNAHAASQVAAEKKQKKADLRHQVRGALPAAEPWETYGDKTPVFVDGAANMFQAGIDTVSEAI